MVNNWKRIDNTTPERVLVMTKIDDADGVRNEQAMSRQGNLWFADNVYVYYSPTHWRELTLSEKAEIYEQETKSAAQSVESIRRLLQMS